jgi:hypothetical protein
MDFRFCELTDFARAAALIGFAMQSGLPDFAKCQKEINKWSPAHSSCPVMAA